MVIRYKRKQGLNFKKEGVKVDYIKAFIAILGGFTVPFFQYLFGEGETRTIMIALLMILIVMDWIAGSQASEKDGSYASEYGIQGVYRTVFIIMLPVVGNLADRILIDYISTLQIHLFGFIIPFTFFGLLLFGLYWHISKSAVANAVRAGWANWLPVSWIEFLLNWVKNEIENKAARAIKRKEDKDKYLEKGV